MSAGERILQDAGMFADSNRLTLLFIMVEFSMGTQILYSCVSQVTLLLFIIWWSLHWNTVSVCICFTGDTVVVCYMVEFSMGTQFLYSRDFHVTPLLFIIWWC